MQKSPYGVAIPSEQLGIENLTTLAVDAIIVGRDIGKALSDGVQLMDGFVIIQDFPKIAEIAQVAKPAFAELKDLTPGEAKDLAANVSARTGLPNDGTVLGKVKTALALAARTYAAVDEVLIVGHEWGNLFQAKTI